MKEKVIKCLWEVEFNINPSLEKSETIENYNFEVVNGQTHVKLTFETDSYDMKSPNTDNEYMEITKACEEGSKIKDLMLERMIYQKIFKPLKIDISGPKLINEKKLVDAGLLNRPVGKSVSNKYNILDVGDSLRESHNYCQSGFINNIQFKKDILRIADWFQRAEAEIDVIDSFIFTWIGFNGLYGLFDEKTKSGKTNNADKFENVINLLLKKEAQDIVDKYKEVLNELETYKIMSGKTNWSDGLGRERRNSNRNDINVIKIAIRCVYGVRNEVFHEAPMPADINERVKNCKMLLKPISAICLKNFITYV